MAHGPQKTRHLAAMVRTVVDHMQHNLPERLCPVVPLYVPVRNSRQHILVAKMPGPFLPAQLERRPIFFEDGKLAVFRVDEGGRRISLHSREPDPVRRKICTSVSSTVLSEVLKSRVSSSGLSLAAQSTRRRLAQAV